jgi:hypothetical protein
MHVAETSMLRRMSLLQTVKVRASARLPSQPWRTLQKDRPEMVSQPGNRLG